MILSREKKTASFPSRFTHTSSRHSNLSIWMHRSEQKLQPQYFNITFQPMRSSASLNFAFIQIKFKSTDTPESRTDSSILIFQDLQYTSVTHTSILTCWVLLKYTHIMFLLFRIYLTSGVFVVL